MSPTYQVDLPEAEAALENTATYITEHDGPRRAANWLRRMIESIDKLETMPARFAARGVRGGRKIRATPVMGHLAYYVIGTTPSCVHHRHRRWRGGTQTRQV